MSFQPVTESERATMMVRFKDAHDKTKFVPRGLQIPGLTFWCCGQEIPADLPGKETLEIIAHLHIERREQT